MTNSEVNIFDKSIWVCPICFCESCFHDCDDFDKIEIDASMQEILKILNDKGYKTQYHCGGHVNKKYQNNFIQIYIRFWYGINFSLDEMNSVGDGWVWDFHHNANDLDFIIKPEIRKNMTEDEVVKLLEKKHKELLNWANKLKENKYGQSCSYYDF